jgi:hypothetical protein
MPLPVRLPGVKFGMTRFDMPRLFRTKAGMNGSIVSARKGKDLSERLEPLDARQDKDMNWRWHVGCSSERPLPSTHAFSEASELLIWNSYKQHRGNTAPRV